MPVHQPYEIGNPVWSNLIEQLFAFAKLCRKSQGVSDGQTHYATDEL